MNSLKFISVVIPTYNRSSLLKPCLDSLASQTYPKSHYEVIVVDDGSTDGTEDFMREYAKRLEINITYYRQENSGPAKARNNGIRLARGEFVAFTDDDCEADRNWLMEIMKEFTSDDIAGVGGMVDSKNNDMLSQYIDYYRLLQPPTEDGCVKYLVTANACYRRKVLLDVNGFSEEIKNPGGEDPDLSYKIKSLGYKFGFNPDSIVIHNHKQNIKSFYRTLYNYGRGNRFLWEKWEDRSSKKALKAPIIEILRWKNLKAIYGYYKYVGVKKAIPFWLLKAVQIYAISRGFRKGY